MEIILLWICEKWDAGMEWIDLAQDRDRGASDFECGNEISGFIKCGEFLDWLKTSWFPGRTLLH
jgi:hypothetical protein